MTSISSHFEGPEAAGQPFMIKATTAMVFVFRHISFHLANTIAAGAPPFGCRAALLAFLPP